MKRILISLVLFVLVLGLSSCQSLDDFVVINRSDDVVEVVYAFMRSPAGHVDVEEPRMMDAAIVKSTNRTWEPASIAEYVIDPQIGKVTVRLAPGKALLLRRLIGYREDSAGADADFGISSLSLTGSKGSIKLEGRQARLSFKFEEQCHVITYK